MHADPPPSSIDLVPDFGRYSSAVRRLWWVLVPFALVVILLVLFVVPSDGEVTVARYAVDQLDHDVSRDNPLGYVPPRRRVSEQATSLNSNETWPALVAANPGIDRPVITGNDAAGVLTFRVAGPPDVVTKTLAAYVGALNELRAKAVEGAARAPLVAAEQSIADLTNEIEGLAPTSSETGSAVDTAAALARAELVGRRAELRQATAVLRNVTQTAEGGVQLLSSERQSTSVVPRSVFAGLGAAVFGLLGIVVFAFVDRAVRRRVDVERVLGGGALLGAVGADAPAPQIAALASVTRALAAPGTAVCLVGVGRNDARPLAAALQAAGAPDLVGSDGLDIDGSVTAHVDGAPVVLVARQGSIDEATLAGAAHTLARCGADIRGVVLTDVRGPVGRVLA